MIVQGKDTVGYFCVHTVGDKIDVTHRGSSKQEIYLMTEDDLRKMADANPNLHYDRGKLWEIIGSMVRVEEVSWLRRWYLNALAFFKGDSR